MLGARIVRPLVLVFLTVPIGAGCASRSSSVATDKSELNTDTGTFKYRVGAYNEAHFDGSSPHGGNGLRSVADDTGLVSIDLPAGEHTVLFAKRSSHSVESTETFHFTIVGGTVNEPDLGEVLFTRPEIVACSDAVGFGRALYVTGETGRLGEWQRAHKMIPGHWRGSNCWSWQGYARTGIEFKIVRAPWSEADAIATSDVEWESGTNHKISEATLYNDNLVHPTF